MNPLTNWDGSKPAPAYFANQTGVVGEFLRRVDQELTGLGYKPVRHWGGSLEVMDGERLNGGFMLYTKPVENGEGKAVLDQVVMFGGMEEKPRGYMTIYYSIRRNNQTGNYLIIEGNPEGDTSKVQYPDVREVLQNIGLEARVK